MRRMLPAPFAMLAQGQFSFARLLVFPRIVIDPFAHVAAEFYEIFAEFRFGHIR